MYPSRRQGSGSQNGGPRSTKHLRTPEQTALDKKRACPACSCLVAPGDPDKVTVEGVTYHGACLKKIK